MHFLNRTKIDSFRHIETPEKRTG